MNRRAFGTCLAVLLSVSMTVGSVPTQALAEMAEADTTLGDAQVEDVALEEDEAIVELSEEGAEEQEDAAEEDAEPEPTDSADATLASEDDESALAAQSLIDISEVSVASIAAQVYTGKEIKPSLEVTYGDATLKVDEDYTLSFENNINVGDATVILKGKGNYTGTKEVKFKIGPLDIAGASVTSIDVQTYTGKEIKPSLKTVLGSITLKRGTDYTASFKDNINVGTATVTLEGKGNYTGSKDVTFKIGPADISKVTVADIAAQTYTSKEIKPSIKATFGGATLKANSDYTLSFKNNVNVGEAVATLKGKGNFTGTKDVKFKIGALDITKASVTSIEAQTYTGKAIKPSAQVALGSITLKRGTDYAVSFKDNINVGTATITFAGKGNYTGKKTATFKILPVDISKVSVATIAEQAFTGIAITPSLDITWGGLTLKKDADYKLSFSNNVNVGTATVTITGKGNFTGSRKVTFKILDRARPLTLAVVSAIADEPYNGKAHTPKPTVKLHGKTLKEGTDYTLSWSNNVEVGKAKVTVTGKGSYKGTVTKTFRIAFKDVPRSHLFYSKIHRANDLGIINGYDGAKKGMFGPGDNITRGQIAVILWNMAGQPDSKTGAKRFSDVKIAAYYYQAIRWASSVGVVNGYGNGKFGPNDNITREQLAVMVANYAKKIGGVKVSGSSADLAGLSDAGSVSGFAVSSVAWCYKKGIFVAQSAKLNAKAKADRATAAQMAVDLRDLAF